MRPIKVPKDFNLTTPRQAKVWTSPTARQHGARAAQRAGASFESAIIRAGDFHRDVVRFKRLPPCGARFVGKNKCVRMPIDCDFHGCVVGSGRGLFFDAKSCGEDTAGLALNNPKVVEPHQRDFLIEMFEVGALAGFLVECKRRKEYLWLNAKWSRFYETPLAWDSSLWVRLGPITHGVRFDLLVKGT